jgi:hypothetical protein
MNCKRGEIVLIFTKASQELFKLFSFLLSASREGISLNQLFILFEKTRFIPFN